MAFDLRAYADESGTHENPSYCVVAGWIGTPRQWRKFDDEWNATLQDKEFRVPDFHSKDFFHRHQNPSVSNPYLNWSPKKAEQFINKLTKAIAVRELEPIGAAVDVHAFMSYSVGERRFLTMGDVKLSGRITGPNTGSPNKPYHTAVHFCISEATLAATPPTQVHFVFDQNDQESAYVLKCFMDLKQRRRFPSWERLGEAIFASRTKEPGLQAADLYTHLWGAFLEHGSAGMGKERNRVWQQVKKRRDWMRVYDAEAFELALESQLLPGQRQGLREQKS